MAYCASRFRTVRRPSREVRVGLVGVGGPNPIRVQSMTTSDTQDVAATVRQSIALAEVGCEIVRVTAPNVQAARCLKDIRQQFTAAGFGAVPLVADIHFLPAAAMEAVEHVEKVRVNPGNYADKKKFAVREYSDADYDRELQRLHEAFSPLVKRCHVLGRAMRIGTNHGSLSDRIMNRYGDSPLGMVESALEFLRICESHGYRDIVLSMKASNPKVMIEAYRLLVQRMQEEDMHYPLHLGVTEAGDGEDGRIKSAIGIGSLLLDGLGDTIRVSLTEDSVYEIPVAKALAEKAMSLWAAPKTDAARVGASPSDSIDRSSLTRRHAGTDDVFRSASASPTDSPESPSAATAAPWADRGNDRTSPAGGPSLAGLGAAGSDSIDPFHYSRRLTKTVALAPNLSAGGENVPRVIVRSTVEELLNTSRDSALRHPRRADTPAEGVMLAVETPAQAEAALAAAAAASDAISFLVLDLASPLAFRDLEPALARPREPAAPGLALLRRFTAADAALLEKFTDGAKRFRYSLICDIGPEDLPALAPTLQGVDFVLGWSGAHGPHALSRRQPDGAKAHPSTALGTSRDDALHPLGAWRRLAEEAHRAGLGAPLWIRATAAAAVRGDNTFLSRLLEASILAGSLLADGLGDLLSIETEPDTDRALRLTYNVLQGAGARVTKTEFVACPSCGRTLFDLQTTTQRIRAQTGHLKGVKIAIMGCIVNGPGEMADADFGYVGGAPGKINLYVGKQCVQYNIPQAEADARLIALIKEHGKWMEPSVAVT